MEIHPPATAINKNINGTKLIMFLNLLLMNSKQRKVTKNINANIMK